MDYSIGDVEDDRKESVTNEVTLSSSTFDPPEDLVDSDSEAVTKSPADTKFPTTNSKKMNESVPNKVTRSFISKRVLVRCDYNPNYFLNGSASSVDVDNSIYTDKFDGKDDTAPHFYTADELRKIIFKPVVVIGGA